jgi:hypothetical protein
MMKVTATNITGPSDDSLVDIHMCAVATMKVTATTKSWEKEHGWIYGRPLLHKKGKWSYG